MTADYGVSLAAAAQTAAQTAAKAEKTRQKLLSLKYTNIYAYLMAGVIGALILRNFALAVLKVVDERDRRRAHPEPSPEPGAEKLRGHTECSRKLSILRLSDRVDSAISRPVPGLPFEWTYVRVFFVTFIVAINTVFSIVGSTHLHSEQSAASSIARAFSRRCGRMAIANYPILFCFAGRNSIISQATGFSYQTLRFYHFLFGGIAFVLSFIHTFAYIAHYTVWQGVDKLVKEYRESYFKWGIVAVVFLLVNCVFGVPWLRRRSYEIFLALHVVGAALILAGTWYHRPICETWVWAAVGVWVAERLVRLVRHSAYSMGRRIFVRKPLIKARAQFVAGAIKLSVPADGLQWAAGQHVYISFWDTGLLRQPWLFGPAQAHPFSIANAPSGAPGDSMRFVMRIHTGLTARLAQLITARTEARGSAEVDCWVSLEGPHGTYTPVSDLDTLLLVAGGSGITHPVSLLDRACRDAASSEKPRSALSKIIVCWAVHREAQLDWVRETLDSAGELARQAGIDLEIRIFVTRSESQASSVASSASGHDADDDYEDKEKYGAGQTIGLAGGARRFGGRPDIDAEVAAAVSDAGRTYIVACGPAQLARDVAKAAAPYSCASVAVEIANSVFGAASTYSTYGGPADDDDLATNPFADLASSSSALPYEPQTTQQTYEATVDPYPTTLSPASPTYEATSPFAAAPYSPPAQETSAYIAPPIPIVKPEVPEPAPEPQTPVSPPAFASRRSYTREAAPTPETPAYQPPTQRQQPGDPDAFTYNPYTSSPPFASRFQQPSSPRDQLGASPFSTHDASSTAAVRAKPDLSALLGDEKPPVPSFKRTDRSPRAQGKAGALGSKVAVLPASSVGRKPVAKPLASLLGLEVEDEPSSSVAAKKQVKADGLNAERPAAQELLVKTDGTGASQSADSNSTPEATPADPASMPLPPSRAETPDLAEAAAEPDVSEARPVKPSLDRSVSDAPSTASASTVSGVNAYDSLVSPLGTESGETPRGEDSRAPEWPHNKPSPELDDRLAGMRISDNTEAQAQRSAASADSSAAAETPSFSSADSSAAGDSYSQYIFSDTTATTTTTAAADSLQRPTMFSEAESGSTLRAPNGSGDEGGFGGTSDADSLRGTYSRSVEPTEAEDVFGTNTATGGRGTPSTDSTAGPGDEVRSTVREGSAPLPPLPPAVLSVQGSPRSTDLGGSLGPTFIITVGDPQKIGYNPATQHTVYTVRTRTTSPSYRKSDFSVLRRYSHFVWLYEALTQNNPGVIVPGMPEKHAIGRFSSDFVENRRVGLQTALNKIVAHPMLVGDPDLRLFLESDTFDVDIKQRKIEVSAENKGLLASLSSSISGPKFVEFDDFFDQRRQQLDVFETQLRGLVDKLAGAAKARSSLQASIAELQSAFLALAQCDLSSSLRKLYDQAATVQQKLYDLGTSQAAHDERVGSLLSVAESYARMCASAKGVFGARVKAYHTWQAAEANVRKLHSAHEKAKRSGRTHSELMNLSVAEIADAERKMHDARHDFDDVSKLTKAEMARFDRDKVDEFKKALEDYADSMAERQREVVRIWQQYHDLLAAAVETSKAAEGSSTSQAAVPQQ